MKLYHIHQRKKVPILIEEGSGVFLWKRVEKQMINFQTGNSLWVHGYLALKQLTTNWRVVATIVKNSLKFGDRYRYRYKTQNSGVVRHGIIGHFYFLYYTPYKI